MNENIASFSLPLIGEVVCVRGGGDIASAIVQKLARSGFRAIVLENEMPTAIRLSVSFCRAVFDGIACVEDVIAIKCEKEEVFSIWEEGKIPLLIDPNADMISEFSPFCVIDAILAKKNLGTNKDMARWVIAAGPGFEAGKDVDVVIETMRGHNLGRLIFEGGAYPNTGIPGEIAGRSSERVLRAPCSGKLKALAAIGQRLNKGDAVFSVEDQKVYAPFEGLLRGLIHEGMTVHRGMKVGDMDPRNMKNSNAFTISDKARCVAGGVLKHS